MSRQVLIPRDPHRGDRIEVFGNMRKRDNVPSRPLNSGKAFAVQVSGELRSLNAGADVLGFRVLCAFNPSFLLLWLPSAPHQPHGDHDRHDDDQDHEDNQEVVGEIHSGVGGSGYF